MGEKNTSKGMSRADFLKTGGVVALAGAALLSTTGCSDQGSTGGSTAEANSVTWDHEADVVVVGSGVGGFTPALLTAQAGLKTYLVEISRHTGGGSAWSGGIMYNNGGATAEEYMQTTQFLSDTELGNAYPEACQEWLHWCQDSGLAVVEPARAGYTANVDSFMLAMGWEDGMFGYGCRELFDSFEDEFAKEGGTLLTRTRGEKILTDEEDNIIGLRCKDADDNVIKIKAKAVVIATGGFQNNQEMKVRYLGEQADMAALLAVPYCTGSGHLMCEEVGAVMSGAMQSFSATVASAWPAKDWCQMIEEYEAAEFDDDGMYWIAQQHFEFQSPDCVYVNNEGKRYYDEDARFYRQLQATVKQTRATGIMVLDSTAWEAWMETAGTYELPKVTVREQFENCILTDKVGGVVYTADSFEELADKMNASNVATHMVHKGNFIKTMNEYNEAVAAGKGEELEVPRYGDKAPLVTPPFYAWPTRPAIYATWGGIAINTNAQALDKNHKPIKGLYCCAPTAGGIMREVYTGAIATAGTTGYWAGKHIIDNIDSI